MAVHIRHGPPGSYKTASAVWIDILGWLRQGREVYTNVRGMLDVPDIEDAIGETFPDTAKLYCVDTDSHQARLAFAGWFHWLPLGAAICIDEAQFIYPDRRDFKAETLDYPGGLDAATAAQRPADIYTAIDKHRHYNWDVCCTTPNIKKIPAWLRGVVETAYHHKAMDHIPLYGKRKSRIHRHDPSTSGTTLTKQSQYELRKIPVSVHALYGSTITGEITKNNAESNPLKNPRFLFFAGLGLAAAISSIALISSLTSSGAEVVETATGPDLSLLRAPDPRPVAPARSREPDPIPVINASSERHQAIYAALPVDRGIYIAGYISLDGDTVYRYRIYDQDSARVVDRDFFLGAGFQIAEHDRCAHDLSHPSLPTLRVVCEPARERGREPSEPATESASTETPRPPPPPVSPGWSSVAPVAVRQF